MRAFVASLCLWIWLLLQGPNGWCFHIQFLCMVSFFFIHASKHTGDMLPQGKSQKNSPSLLLKSKPKTGLFPNLKCLNKHAWAHKQSFGFGHTKTLIMPQWREWALPAEHLWALLSGVCRWHAVADRHIAVGHVSGQYTEIILGVGGAARAPHPPPLLPLDLFFILHRPLTGQAAQPLQNRGRNKAKSLEKWTYTPKSPPATLVVY